MHCIFYINITYITVAWLTTVTFYFADWWHNFVLNIAPGLILLFCSLERRSFSEKGLIYFVFVHCAE